jgi:DNA-binding MurR/RpiR family transcriptional regulator
MFITKKFATQIAELSDQLTPTELRIARLIENDPELIAFGTAASVAKVAETSAPSIVRFADKLGYAGFSGLQKNIRQEVSGQISTAYKRARDPAARRDISAWIEIEVLNVKETLSAIDTKELKRAVKWLASVDRRIFILSSEQWVGPATTLYDFMQIIRPRVHTLRGSPFRVACDLGAARRGDVLLTIDAQRNETWVVETHDMARGRGLKTIAITDGPLNIIATRSDVNFRVSLATCGIFESKAGLMALINFLLDAVVKETGESVTERLAYMETVWSKPNLLGPV